jgi:glycosyltransferase 2 family protein
MSQSDPNVNPASRSPSFGRWIGRTIAILTALMAVYLAATFWASHENLQRGVQQFRLQSLPGVIGLVLLGLALRAARWQYYVWRLHWPVPAAHSIAAFLASFAFTATPGKAGEVVKSVLLQSHFNVPLADGVGVLLVERLGDLLAVLIMALGGLHLLSDKHGYLGTVQFSAAVALIVGTTIVVGSRRIYGPIIAEIAKIKKLSGAAQKVLQLLDAGHALLRPVPFLIGMGLALIAWGCEGVAFQWLLEGFGVRMPILTAFAIYGIATLVGALSMLPGGIGGFEVVMGLLLAKVGMKTMAATPPIAVFRLCTLWLGSLIGLAFLFGWLAVMGQGGRDIAALDEAFANKHRSTENTAGQTLSETAK